MQQTPQRQPWPAPRPLSEAEAQAWARYEALSPAERDRARRLIALSGCTLGQAVAAVEATRQQ